ncbi:MAG: DUF1858 domain-containing protein [Candidatus Woesearchaeota archaeon]
MDKAKPRITEEMLIGELVEKYPQVIPTLMALGVHCIGCGVSAFESIGDGLRGHGMTEEEVKEAIEALNRAAEEELPEGHPLK